MKNEDSAKYQYKVLNEVNNKNEDGFKCLYSSSRKCMMKKMKFKLQIEEGEDWGLPARRR